MSFTRPFKIRKCITDEDLLSHPSKHNKFYPALSDGKFSDFTLIYKRDGEVDREFKVHKIFLYNSSKYFQAMLDGPWKEQLSADLALTDSINFTVFEDFLTYLYTNSFQKDIHFLNCRQLYELANYYIVPELTEQVVRIMKQSIGVNNINDYLAFMEEKEMDKNFKDIIINFVSKNYRQLVSNNFEFHKLGKLVDSVFANLASSSSASSGSDESESESDSEDEV